MNKLIAIVGMSGSGKSVTCSYLEENGFNNIYFGGIVLDELKKRNMERTFENEKIVREELRKQYGMSAIARLALPRIRESIKNSDTVLDGVYSFEEYKLLIEEFPNLKLIAIVADKELRYKRVSMRDIRPHTKEEVRARDISEIEKLNKGGPLAIADYYICNNGDIENYHERLKDILECMEEGEK